MRTSKILIALSATQDASAPVLDAFQMIQSDKPSVKVLFISYLSDLFKKSLGPNTLTHWVKEEKECIEKVSRYFTGMNIPYASALITVPPWEMVFEEMSEEVQDLIILQTELLDRWKMRQANGAPPLDAVSRAKCPILVVNSSEGGMKFVP